jgi:transposase-like protein
MNTKKQGRKPIYDNGFKVALAREYLTSELGYGALASKHGLSSAAKVRAIVTWYKRKFPNAVDDKLHLGKAEVPPMQDLNSLSVELKEANLKIAGLEMMIEIAQKELGIDIIKKRGTKQSSK